MLSIGVTGGLGSGKSAAMSIFYELGANTLNADDIAKNLLRVKPGLIAQVKEAFGADCYVDDELQTGILAARAFCSPAEIRKLNAISHPALREHLNKYIAATKTVPGILMVEAAVLFEAGFEDLFDTTLLITADEEIRLRRSLERQLLDEHDIRQRMAMQMPETDKRRHATHIIENNGDESALRDACRAFWEKINEQK